MKRFLTPTLDQEAIEVGSKVFHLKWGVGKVLDEWGVWSSCRGCYAPVDIVWNVCPHCGMDWTDRERGPIPLRVGGHGIVDIEFRDGKTRSIHKVWLQPIF